MRIPRIPFSEILHFVEVLAIVGATTFAAFQLRTLRQQNSADLTLRLGQELETGINQNLINALDADPTKPILTKSGGQFTVAQLDWYLGEYETLDDLYRSGLITCRMMYNEFSTTWRKLTKTRTLWRRLPTSGKTTRPSGRAFSI
jgi:hypothetical protein